MNMVGKGTMKQLHAKYMVPSAFGYKGLENQKRTNYDQFLRSNIDNEHDNRNFLTEDGEDALPFRTMRSEVYTSEKTTMKDGEFQIGEGLDLRATMKPGESMMVPLRWNNPHSAELEVNIWIFSADKPVVVPVKKPTCSGEGRQDNIFKFTIPSDFNQLGSKIPGFKGCNADTTPPCTLQIYSHSVETRTYSIGSPIIVTGHDAAMSTSSEVGVLPMTKDPSLDITSLRDLCLPSFDPASDIKKAVPRWARLVSDVYNHAYQNSDFSPYSGQQHESISKNLQAAAINKMVTGNRGELGKYALTYPTSKRLRALGTLENRIYRNYESIANNLIKEFGDQMLQGQGITLNAEGSQQVLGKCFRCGEVGSLLTKRLTTNTYIPSFQMPQNLVSAARTMVATKYEKYTNLVTEGGMVQIYMAAFTDLAPFYYASMSVGVLYLGASLKPTLTTKADSSKFRRKGPDPSIRRRAYDRGQFAANMAINERATELGCDLRSCSPPNPIPPTWPSTWCEDGRAPALMQGLNSTCVTGKCIPCGAFFGATLKIGVPHITSLAREIASSGQAPSTQSTIPVYPDLDGSPRFGRDEDVEGEDDVWKLVEGGKSPATTTIMTTTTIITTTTTTTTMMSNPRRRRRRRRRSSSKTRRRRRRSSSKEVGKHQ